MKDNIPPACSTCQLPKECCVSCWANRDNLLEYEVNPGVTLLSSGGESVVVFDREVIEKNNENWRRDMHRIEDEKYEDEMKGKGHNKKPQGKKPGWFHYHKNH